MFDGFILFLYVVQFEMPVKKVEECHPNKPYKPSVVPKPAKKSFGHFILFDFCSKVFFHFILHVHCSCLMALAVKWSLDRRV